MLRSILLATTSILLAIPAFAQNAAPTVEIGGGIENEEFLGSLDVFLPLVRDVDRVLFGNGRFIGRGDESFDFSGGIGYRQDVGGGWVLGINGFYDFHRSRLDHTFHQASLGLEALSADWEARANVYVPFGDRHGSVEAANRVFLEDDALVFRAGRETALTGVDAEIGARIPVFEPGSDLLLKVFGGGYYFDEDEVDDARSGVTGRLEFSIAGLARPLDDSTLTFVASVRHDDEEGTDGTFIARLRVPFGESSGPKPDAYGSTFNRRVARGGVMTSIGATGPEEAALYADTGEGVGRVARVGSGDDAVSINADIVEAGENGLVIANGGIEVDDTIALQDGQRLVGGGSRLAILGARSGGGATFTAPGEEASIAGTNSAADVIALADRSGVYDLAISGGRSGIVATGIGDFTVRDVDISATAMHGIEMRDVEGALIENVTISGLNHDGGTFSYTDPEVANFAGIFAVGARDLTIRNVEVDTATTGLFLSSIFGDGEWEPPTVRSENVTIENLTVRNTGREALLFVGARNIALNNVSLLNPGIPMEELDQFVLLSTSDVTARNLTIRGGTNGIMIVASLAEPSERLSFTNVTIENTIRSGIFLNPSNDLTFRNVTITNAGTSGITTLGFPGFPPAFPDQSVANVTFDNVRVNGAAEAGLALNGPAENFNGNIVVENATPACSTGDLIDFTLTQGAGNVFSVNGSVLPAGTPTCP